MSHIQHNYRETNEQMMMRQILTWKSGVKEQRADEFEVGCKQENKKLKSDVEDMNNEKSDRAQRQTDRDRQYRNDKNKKSRLHVGVQARTIEKTSRKREDCVTVVAAVVR
mgnify:CR=1 FL=1